MPMPILSVPKFPNVPMVAGVPPLLRDPSAPDPSVDNRPRADAAKLPKPVQQTWGLFKASGERAITPETILSVSYRDEARIPTYPQEEGAFSSYNKVEMPYDVRLTVAQGGDEKARRDFLDALTDARRSLDLFSMVMPEVTLTDLNIVHIAYDREQRQGANMLVVEIGLIEVRVTGQQTLSKSKQADGADPAATGAVSPRSPTTSESAAAAASTDTAIQQSAATGN